MTTSRALLVNGFLALAAMGGALAVTEVVVRIVSPQPTGLSHQDRYGLGMHYPGITRYLPQYGHDVSFNSVGMRDREHTLEKPTGVFRILLLGDSFMEALQVPFEASLPYLLEKQLGERTGKQVEVVNAGVSGWGTDDELRYLTQYGLQYQPDLVVVAMTLHNDISDNLRQDWHTMRGDSLVEQPREPMSFLRYKVVELKAFIATRFQTYQLWRRVRHGGEIRQTGKQLNSHIVQLFREPTPDQITWGYRFTGLLLQRMQAVTAAEGGHVVLVLLPLRVQLSDSSFSSFVQSAAATPAQMPPGKPQRVITGIADGLGIPVIDLLPSFRQRTAESDAPLYVLWDGHWNEAGHRLAAAVVTQGLLDDGAVH
jgi:hypothetical protein